MAHQLLGPRPNGVFFFLSSDLRLRLFFAVVDTNGLLVGVDRDELPVLPLDPVFEFRFRSRNRFTLPLKAYQKTAQSGTSPRRKPRLIVVKSSEISTAQPLTVER